jgi:hypothetical protein
MYVHENSSRYEPGSASNTDPFLLPSYALYEWRCLASYPRVLALSFLCLAGMH